jgi:hypothetical protein
MESDHKKVLDALTDGKIDDKSTNIIEKVGAEIAKNFKV